MILNDFVKRTYWIACPEIKEIDVVLENGEYWSDGKVIDQVLYHTRELATLAKIADLRDSLEVPCTT